MQGWRLCAVSASQCQILYLFSTSLQLSTRIPKPILHHWWIILIRCCNFCQQDWASWCNLFLVRSLFRSRFQNENSVKGKATVSWRGICWTHTSLTNSNVTPTGSVLSSWQSLGFALKTQPFKPFKPLSRTGLNWTQPKHHEHHKSMQKCLKQSVSPFGLCAFATCCTHRRLWIFLPPQWLWANQEKSHSKKNQCSSSVGGQPFAVRKHEKMWALNPTCAWDRGDFRKTLLHQQQEMEATASKYM